jgi:hypothetical protein
VPSRAPARYDAFLSYSHAADGALAPALQSALHRLARPWNRLRALTVFRDKTSLSASPELWPAIVTALSDARYFLLLASPAAAGSKWVQKEVEWWLEHRSPQTMLILVTDGQLAWDEGAGDFDWAHTDAIAPLLGGRFPSEPLWVDLRWARSGETLSLRHLRFRQAVLDVAAPLHGRSKDELDGEDVRQFARTKRLTRGAIAVVVALTVAVLGAGVFAVQQSTEAGRQTAIAGASRLAAQADLQRERGGPIDPSTMMAAEAVRMMDAIGERSLETDRALRRALLLQPRRLGEFGAYNANELSVASDGRHFAVTPIGRDPSMHDARGASQGGCSFQPIRDRLDAQGIPSATTHVKAVTPDGRHCVTITYASPKPPEIRLWSAAPLAERARMSHPGGPLPVVALSEDAEYLAITDHAPGRSTDTPGRFQIWSVSRGVDVVAKQGANFIAFGPDRRLFAATDGIWRLPAPGEPAATRVMTWPRQPWQIRFSGNGRIAATQDETSLMIWDLASGKRLHETGAGPGSLLAVHDDGRLLLLDTNESAALWDVETAQVVGVLAIQPVAAYFEPDAVVFVAAPEDNRATIFAQRLSSGAVASTSVTPGETVRWLGIDGTRVMMVVDAGSSARVETWTPPATARVTQARADGPAPVPIAISPDNRRFAFGRPSGALVGSLIGASDARDVALGGRPVDLVFSGDGGILGATLDDRFEVRSLRDGAAWHVSLPPGAQLVGLSSDGRWAAAVRQLNGPISRGGDAYELVAWRTFSTVPSVSVMLGRHLHMPGFGCQVGADAGTMRVGEAIVDLGKATVRPLERKMAQPCQAIVSATLQATVDERQVFVSDRLGRPLARLDHPAPVHGAALADDARRAVTVDERGVLRLWALAPRDLVAQACAEAPQPLDDATWAQYLPATLTVDACGRARSGAGASDAPAPR